MAGIAEAVLSGSGAALAFIRQYLSNPSITYTDPNTGISQTVTIQATGYEEILQNQVSKMLLVDVSKGKTFINDNIAPQPRAWEITGYLFPLVPSVIMIDQIVLQGIQDTLRAASDSRQLVDFRPIASSITAQFSQAFGVLGNSITGTIKVAIESITFSLDPAVQNKIPVKMKLQKVNTLTASIPNGNDVLATPNGQENSIGNPNADPSNMGNTGIVAMPGGAA